MAVQFLILEKPSHSTHYNCNNLLSHQQCTQELRAGSQATEWSLFRNEVCISITQCMGMRDSWVHLHIILDLTIPTKALLIKDVCQTAVESRVCARTSYLALFWCLLNFQVITNDLSLNYLNKYIMQIWLEFIYTKNYNKVLSS